MLRSWECLVGAFPALSWTSITRLLLHRRLTRTSTSVPTGEKGTLMCRFLSIHAVCQSSYPGPLPHWESPKNRNVDSGGEGRSYRVCGNPKRLSRNPENAPVPGAERYLTIDRNVASSTQNQACSAILFLYRDVLIA